MVDYEKKYKEYTNGWLQCIPDISNEYPECNGFEKCVIAFRKEGWTYGGIQSRLGMPSKKQIRQVLLKWAPELIDNSIKKTKDMSDYESELYSLLRKEGRATFNVFGEDWEFFIEGKTLKYIDVLGEHAVFGELDIASQSQILNEIKEQMDER